MGEANSNAFLEAYKEVIKVCTKKRYCRDVTIEPKGWLNLLLL